MWQGLIANIAVVALFISLWVHAQQVLELRPSRYRKPIFAAVMGLAAVSTMWLPVELFGGIAFDLRGLPIAMAGLFAGPAVLVTVAMVATTQFLIGGPLLGAGLAATAATAAVSATAALLIRPPASTIVGLLLGAILGLANGIAFAALTPAQTALERLVTGGAISFAAGLGTLLCALALILGKRLAGERALMRAAVAQAPDIFFARDRLGRFVAANIGLARAFGRSRPDELIGLTYSDVFPADRAAALSHADAEIMATGGSMADIPEQLPGADGQMRLFSTSKSALRDSDGTVIGIAGVTRDVTERHRLEAEAQRDHALVTFALAEMSDGLAMFDPNGVLVLCNDRYTETFPLTGHIRRPGATVRQIIEAVAETGEEVGIPEDPVERKRWIENTVNGIKREAQVEFSISNGRWVQLRTRPTKDGSSLVVVSDITAIKNSELMLQGMTDQLKELATTDGLTGLLNRRSLDQVLAAELARTVRERQPISLLMIDVDRFKAYNDRYGHPAGDKCLKLVANSLREAALRPGDSLARYGGEEFVAVLPNTDEDGAYVLAERLRRSLRDLGLPHEGSEKGLVTVSVGIACYPGTVIERTEAELLRRADQALYDAKAAGRDRVTGFRHTHEVVPRRLLDGTRVAVR